MGANPSESVVNRYLQHWDVPNLFVVGASAFPHNSGYNPTGYGRRADLLGGECDPHPISEIARSAGAGMRLAALAACLLLGLAVKARAEQGSFAQIAEGRYLVAAGDCKACHVPEGAQTMSGGVPLRTPFGTIYSSNISSDPETGIGAWTLAQFERAMRHGRSADGSRLYPAFPYPWFTKVTDQDIARDLRLSAHACRR